ncbi:metal-dependent hydrolase [Listeria welshimeri]|uniref:metal-dependent hydrolase n=1 Tax=Listeria welshimeri TaxID=1643 RepID=UPI001D01171A|nr:metal-dependent hydrolase [Listeria welshimeri]
MRYKTHLITTFVLATPSANLTNNLNLLGVCGLAIGALLPDIDKSNSFIGKRITIILNIVEIIFGHREME